MQAPSPALLPALSRILLAASLLATAPPLLAQRGAPAVRRVAQLERAPQAPAAGGPARELAPARAAELEGAGPRPVILLTGYWPPTNEAIRRFSRNPARNPQGWIGANWEGRGYDVVSYFPEFTPPNCTNNCGPGEGALTVDYQDTVRDWGRVVGKERPIALITFSRGFDDLSWELEMNQYNRMFWFHDFIAPTQPTPAPPDPTVPVGHLRNSSLPVQEIVDAVTAANLGLAPVICFSQDGGGFLSEFVAYLGVWHKETHDDPADPDWCVAAGHVHVGGQIPAPTARVAAEVTLRTLIDHVDAVIAGTP